jgi:predicted HicB family RNase H-like nuclease
LGVDKPPKCRYNNGMKKITIRIPDEQEHLHDAIIKSAQKNHRSLNGEILRAFEFYLESAPDAPAKTVTKEVTKKKSP